MKKGTRALRYPVDTIDLGADQEFVNARAEIKARWAADYGFSLYAVINQAMKKTIPMLIASYKE